MLYCTESLNQAYWEFKAWKTQPHSDRENAQPDGGNRAALTDTNSEGEDHGWHLQRWLQEKLDKQTSRAETTFVVSPEGYLRVRDVILGVVRSRIGLVCISVCMGCRSKTSQMGSWGPKTKSWQGWFLLRLVFLTGSPQLSAVFSGHPHALGFSSAHKETRPVGVRTHLFNHIYFLKGPISTYSYTESQAFNAFIWKGTVSVRNYMFEWTRGARWMRSAVHRQVKSFSFPLVNIEPLKVLS